MDIEAIDTGNQQLVGLGSGGIVVMLPRGQMTFAEALVHAAWIVALAEQNEGDFARVLARVQGS